MLVWRKMGAYYISYLVYNRFALAKQTPCQKKAGHLLNPYTNASGLGPGTGIIQNGYFFII